MRLYDIKENVEALKGEFQASLQVVGEISHATNPQNIKVVPKPEDLLMMDQLHAIAAQQ
ncbi:hypothetical protein HED50_21385 [Ochrobactrum oryzae]|nr:hypothetical protein [Brucella oryzae]